MKALYYLSLLLIPLSLNINTLPSKAQDSFASRCYLTGSSMRATGLGATQYVNVFWGYEVCIYYTLNEPIVIKGSDETTKFTLPSAKSVETCINEMRSNETKTCN